VGVNWYEAYAYCVWRNGRLPTEAEWEWAACGPENRIYPWGNEFDPHRVIYDGNNSGKTAVVGSNIRMTGSARCGVLDMSGNVWEWVNSLYKPYPSRSDDGRENPNTDDTNHRVLRRGSWVSLNASFLRTSVRDDVMHSR